MGQQISMEDAFPTFQKRCTELFEANLLLQAQVDVQERQISALAEENERLQQGSQPSTEPGPRGGTDLATAAPYTPDENA